MSDFSYLQGLLDSGPRVAIPPGPYSITQTLVIDRNDVSVSADGVTITSTAPVALRLGDGSDHRDDLRVSGLTLVGGGLEARYCFRTHLERLKIRNAPTGLRIVRGYQFHVSGCDVRFCAEAGIVIEGESNDQYLRDIRVVGDDVANPCTGVLVKRTSGLWMDDVGTIECFDGFRFAPDAGHAVEYVFTSRCSADLGRRYGWHLLGSSGTIRGWTSVSDWASSNAWTGLLAQHCSDLNVTATRVLNNLEHGIHFVLCKDSAVRGCSVSGNGSKTPGSFHGVVLDHCDGIRVSDNRSGQFGDYAHSQGFGLFEVACTNVYRSNNDLRRNLNG